MSRDAGGVPVSTLCAPGSPIQAAGMEPDIWKIEGLDRAESCELLSAIADVAANYRRFIDAYERAS